MSILKFDEINRLGMERRSEPINEYFRPMNISAQRRKRREEMAERYFKAMMEYISFLDEFIGFVTFQGEILKNSAQKILEDGLMDVIAGYVIMDSVMTDYVKRVSAEINDSTIRHINDPYYRSEDRAMLIAEDESNGIVNHDELQEAIRNGKKYKTWNTMRDRKVRDTHRPLEGKKIPIEEYFNVGGVYMMCPRDPDVDAPEETCGCRCWLTFS